MSSARLKRDALQGTPLGGIAQPSMTSSPLPQVDQHLINYLKAAFPVRVEAGKELRDYDRMAGQQEVIEHLQSLLQRLQQE